MKTRVAEFRKLGWKVKIHHYRWVDDQLVMRHEIPSYIDRETKGGKTIVSLTRPDGQKQVGVANCSKQDGYNKKLGINIALGRALAGFGMSLKDF